MLQELILFSGFSWITVFLGALLAYYFNHHVDESPAKCEMVHGMMSFGAGIMLAALALVLVPEGMKELWIWNLSFYFLAGAIVFLLLDNHLSKKWGETATLMAMLMDFLPESIALGAVFAIEPSLAILLAVFIGLQNFPEAFNAYRDIRRSGCGVKKSLTIFFFLSFLWILAASLGYYVLTDYPHITAQLMIFASGWILYLLIQDIIPDSKLEKHSIVSLGACLGFLVWMIGEKVIS